MAEITYQMVLSTLQTAGLLVGIFYYILTLRNQQKNQELTLRNQELTLKSQKQTEDTRKIQILHDINKWTTEDDSNLNWFGMMNMKWDDYADFTLKDSLENNPDLYNGRIKIWRKLNLYGILINDGLIDASTFVRIIADQSPIVWSKFKPIVEKMRLLQDNPELYMGMEILAQEVDNYRISKGLKPKTSTVRSYKA